MSSKLSPSFKLLSLAAVVGSALCGCGGSSSSVQGNSPTISTTGGLTTNTGAGTPGASSGSTPTQVPVTVNGSVVTGTLPANETIPASGNVDVISPGVPILVGLTLAPKSSIHKGLPTVSNGAQGEVDVDGCDTGLTVDSQGDLSGYLILTPGTHNITAMGPFDIVGGSIFKPTNLSIGKFVFNVTVNPDGIASIPSALSVKLPANGGALKNGNFVKVTYPTPDFKSGQGVLILAWSGVTITSTKVVGSGKVTFNSLSNNTPVPATGLDSVTYNYIP